jgi:hypothetical protein
LSEQLGVVVGSVIEQVSPVFGGLIPSLTLIEPVGVAPLPTPKFTVTDELAPKVMGVAGVTVTEGITVRLLVFEFAL